MVGSSVYLRPLIELTRPSTVATWFLRGGGQPSVGGSRSGGMCAKLASQPGAAGGQQTHTLLKPSVVHLPYASGAHPCSPPIPATSLVQLLDGGAAEEVLVGPSARPAHKFISAARLLPVVGQAEQQLRVGGKWQHEAGIQSC